MTPDEAKRIVKAVRDIDAAREVFTEVCAERDRLRAERDAARADALALAAERNNWQSMYQDAMAERDEARALNSAMIAMLPSTYYMDPPDGGSVMPEEQMRRMSQDAARYRWLRSDAPPESSRWPRWSLEHWSGAAWCPIRGAELDAAIDAALKDAP